MFELALALTLGSYFFQIHKTYQSGQSDGVSLSGYLISLVNAGSFIFWSTGDLQMLKAIELLLIVGTTLYLYTQSSHLSKPTTGDLWIFGIALFASLNLISGVAQSIKSFRGIGPKDVSFLTYFLLYTANFLYLYLAWRDDQPITVFVGLVGTNTLYTYILYRAQRG